MRLFRRVTLGAVLAVGAIAIAIAPAGAGRPTPASVSGVAVCDTTTGLYHLSWTIAKTSNPSSPTTITSGTQTPSSADLVVPTVIPADPLNQGVLQSVVATSTLPGTTSGSVTFDVVVEGDLSAPQASVTLDGTCAIAQVAAAPEQLTG